MPTWIFRPSYGPGDGDDWVSSLLSFSQYMHAYVHTKVINVGSDTFDNPIFHEGLQNFPEL